MKWIKILVPLNVLNLIALIAVTFQLPKFLMIYLNVVPIFNFVGPNWVVPIVGLLPFIIIACMVYQNKHKQQDDERARKNEKAEAIVMPVITLMITALPWVSVLMAEQKTADMQTRVVAVIGVVLGIVMLVLGNYMGVIKQNKYLGIKCRWTLKSEEVWRRTHRVSAYLTIIGGLLLIAFSAACWAANVLWVFYLGLTLSLVLIALVPYVYSFLLYHRLYQKSK